MAENNFFEKPISRGQFLAYLTIMFSAPEVLSACSGNQEINKSFKITPDYQRTMENIALPALPEYVLGQLELLLPKYTKL